MSNKLEYGVEYYPNNGEGKQWQELTETKFLSLLRDHKAINLNAVIEYTNYQIFKRGPYSGKRLTIRDEYGVYYG